MEMQEKKLRCVMSKFKTELSFNEWTELLGVSSQYRESVQYYRGNPSIKEQAPESPYQQLLNYLRK